MTFQFAVVAISDQFLTVNNFTDDNLECYDKKLSESSSDNKRKIYYFLDQLEPRGKVNAVFWTIQKRAITDNVEVDDIKAKAPEFRCSKDNLPH